MRIALEEVRHIAKLAHLALADDELQSLQGDLARILDHVEALNALDLDNVPPTTHPVALPERVRPDTVETSWPIDRVLRGAPEASGGGFAVPKIIGT